MASVKVRSRNFGLKRTLTGTVFHPAAGRRIFLTSAVARLRPLFENKTQSKDTRAPTRANGMPISGKPVIRQVARGMNDRIGQLSTIDAAWIRRVPECRRLTEPATNCMQFIETLHRIIDADGMKTSKTVPEG